MTLINYSGMVAIRNWFTANLCVSNRPMDAIDVRVCLVHRSICTKLGRGDKFGNRRKEVGKNAAERWYVA